MKSSISNLLETKTTETPDNTADTMATTTAKSNGKAPATAKSETSDTVMVAKRTDSELALWDRLKEDHIPTSGETTRLNVDITYDMNDDMSAVAHMVGLYKKELVIKVMHNFMEKVKADDPKAFKAALKEIKEQNETKSSARSRGARRKKSSK